MFVLTLLSEERPNTELGWYLWVVFGFFLLMIFVGWLVSSKKKPAEAPVQMEHKVAHGHDDDLEIIEGIGPRVARVLNAAGILSFADLADANPERILEMLKAARLSMMDPAGWIDQARLAARGDMEGLKRMQDEMKGGRQK